jgi:hypothetical protein
VAGKRKDPPLYCRLSRSGTIEPSRQHIEDTEDKTNPPWLEQVYQPISVRTAFGRLAELPTGPNSSVSTLPSPS